jgi:Ni/Co efflux regulator RcnB
MLAAKGTSMDKKTLLAAVLAALAVAPALAEKGGAHGHGNRHDGGYEVACPPGLARKHDGCLPPGQAKKVYRDAVVGHHVPPQAVYVVPRHVRATLPTPPAGYRYAVVNNQVVLVSSTDIVVDIIRSVLG